MDTIQAPNISYDYAISAGDANKRITDDQNVSVLTKAGITTGVTITGTVAWSDSETLDAADDGAANLKGIDITFPDSTFSAAGVYRYVITETMTDGFTKPTSGVTEGGISNIRYLDVYVKDGATAGEYVIYGYVCFENNLDHINDGSDKTTPAATAAVKTKGFVDATTTSSTLTADSYYTYNVTVGKKLVNDNANITNQFPFTVTFTNGTITQNVNLISVNTGNVTLAEIASASIETGLVSEPTIAHDGTVKYIGIPCGTSVAVYETNNVTTSAYMSKCDTVDTSAGDTEAAEKLINEGVASNTALVTTSAVQTGAAAAKTVTFTNTLALISPTGVAMAVVPFVLLMAFGIGFMVVSTTKRKEEYEV